MLRSFSEVGAKIRRKIDEIEVVVGDSKRAANIQLARTPPAPPPQNPPHHAKPSQSFQIEIPFRVVQACVKKELA